MRNAVALATLAVLVAAPAPASDFARLADPAVARGFLLAPEREREVQCVAAAYAAATAGPSRFTVADGAAMAAALADRLAVELGGAADARELLDHRVASFLPYETDSTGYARAKAKGRALVLAKCGPLLDRYASGGAAGFRAALRPATGLIPLLGLDQCLAILDASDRLDHPLFSADERADLKKQIVEGMGAAERARLDAGVAAAARKLAEARGTDGRLEQRSIACLATFRREMERRPAYTRSGSGTGG